MPGHLLGCCAFRISEEMGDGHLPVSLVYVAERVKQFYFIFRTLSGKR